MKLPILTQLKNTGLPLSNWCSDIYVPITSETKGIIKSYEYKQNIITFTDQITGKAMFEIPFIYDYKNLGDLQ